MGVKLLENHRTRVGAERRQRARARLLESALLVFSKKGPEAAVIDDVIALAGMSRGSFYNYFKSNEELLEAAIQTVANELLCLIDPLVQPHSDPIARIACGTRLFLHTIRQYPLLGEFLARLRWPLADQKLIGIAFLRRDIELSRIHGEISCSKQVAFDLIVGTMLGAVGSLVRGNQDFDYPEAMISALLQGLGVDSDRAKKLAILPLGEAKLDATSILFDTLGRNTSCGRQPA